MAMGVLSVFKNEMVVVKITPPFGVGVGSCDVKVRGCIHSLANGYLIPLGLVGLSSRGIFPCEMEDLVHLHNPLTF